MKEKAMGTALLCIDDSYNAQHRILALTGVVVPVETYVEAREELYARLFARLDGREKYIWTRAPELHASDLLREAPDFLPAEVELSDELRFEVTRDVVEIVRDYGLTIFRLGYYVPPCTTHVPPVCTKDFYYGLCLDGLLGWLHSVYGSDQHILPVMDLGDPKIMSSLRASVTSAQISGPRLEQLDLATPRHARYRRIVGELLFTDSNASPFIQLADMTGYLLMAAERKRFGHTLTRYKERLAEYGEQLRPFVAAQGVQVLTWNGSPVGPMDLEYVEERGDAPATSPSRRKPT